MKNSLALFDSGVGGITVLRQLLGRHPEVSCLYLADCARLPYGNKSPFEIRVIAEEIVGWLKDQKVAAILMACNTTNSLAFDIVKNLAEVPVFGLIGAAAEMLQQKPIERVGVLSTPATAASGAYRKQIVCINPDISVLEVGCADFVPLIEAGLLDDQQIRQAAFKYLRPLIDQRVEAIVLGCTHYPLIIPVLREILPENVDLIDPAIGLAQNVDSLLGVAIHKAPQPISLENTKICVTSDPVGFSERAFKWLGMRPKVDLVSLRKEACFFGINK